MVRPTLSRIFCAAVVLAMLIATPVTSTRAASSGGGMGIRSGKAARPPLNLGTIFPAETFANAEYGSGGTGLRNRGGGSVAISGVTGPIKKAFIYWAVITEGPPAAPNYAVLVQRLLPTISDASLVTGEALGTGATPCWGGDRITVFRGTVPPPIANGNGQYQITLQHGASGTIGGAGPWESAILPLMEGASIVMIGTGSATVSVFDKRFAGNTFYSDSGLLYSLKLPASSPGHYTLFDDIGADGQHGTGPADFPGESLERTVLNGTVIAGPGSRGGDGDWNGNSGFPLPQLWDDSRHDISSSSPAGTKTLNFSVSNDGLPGYDCLTTVANVVSSQ